MIEIKQLPSGISFEIEHMVTEASPETSSAHRHEYFEIFWTIKGEGKHRIDFVEYPLSPGMIYFMTPGQVHECTHLPDEMYAISFNAEFINSDYRSQLAIDQVFLQNRVHHPSIKIDDLGMQELLSLVNVMNRELRQPEIDNDLLSILMTGFLRYLIRYQPNRDDTPYLSDERMVLLLTLIDKNFSIHRETEFYSKQLSLTNKRVNELTKRHFSKTVTQLIHDRIILEARRELIFTRKTVKDIALSLGYDDTAYFCRFFRKSTGESPMSFRQAWSKN
jgi:AraC-like DNA-binding protein